VDFPAKKDFDLGYTINEGNAIYEPYPYQINKYLINEYLTFLTSQIISE
jgi:hypothetical protein